MSRGFKPRLRMGGPAGPAKLTSNFYARPNTQYLRVYVGHLRTKLEKDPAAPRIVLTEPGIGYRLM